MDELHRANRKNAGDRFINGIIPQLKFYFAIAIALHVKSK